MYSKAISSAESSILLVINTQTGEVNTSFILNCKCQDEAKDVTANNIYRQKLIFVPGKRLKNMMKQAGVTRLVAKADDIPEGNEGSGGNEGGADGDQGENPLG